MKLAIKMPPLMVVVPAVTLLLAACQQQELPTTHSSELSQGAANLDSAAVDLANLDSADVGAAAEEAVPEPASPEAQAEAATEPLGELVTSEPEPAPLNLSIPRDILEETSETGFPSQQPEQRVALPDLFAKKQKSGTKVSSKLHFEEGETASMDTISGAEITVKVPLD